MFGSIRSPIASLLSASTSSPFASSSRHVLAPTFARSAPIAPVQHQSVRYRAQLAPKRTKYRKSMKGMPIKLPTGGSIKGTTLARGTFGIRLLKPARLSAAQLTSCREAIKKKIKAVKGAEVFMRVFPDIPVCVKGNEVRMGKGKGSFEFWATRVTMGKVVFEVGGGGIREEIAKQALRLAQVKLPVTSEFITAATPPRLGHLVSADLTKPLQAQKIPVSVMSMASKRVGETARKELEAKALIADLDQLSIGTPPPQAAAV